MNAYNADSIVASIVAALHDYPGRPHSDFYVGITDDLDRRLSEHNIISKDCLRFYVPRITMRHTWQKVHL